MLDIDLLEERNRKYIKILLEKYDIKMSVDSIVDLSSIYIAKDNVKDNDKPLVKKLSRIRLMGTEKIYLMEETQGYDNKIDTKKTRKVQLYVINNKKLQELNKSNDLATIIQDFNFLCSIVKETQDFKNIRELESNMCIVKPLDLD